MNKAPSLRHCDEHKPTKVYGLTGHYPSSSKLHYRKMNSHAILSTSFGTKDIKIEGKQGYYIKDIKNSVSEFRNN